MRNLLNVVRDEPVLFLEAVRSALILFVAFGLSLTDGQLASTLLFVSSLISLAARQRVEPL